ncbi:iron uptake porin [Trichocoleus sp. FACHB-90]|uniref:iron uptake porin n=1 Tax=Cyanophyceae TaxID=3028117 RepID=UPI00168964DC|nr:iron uptake porin [Trichocoleus sp. FACHB-90]MBD1929739.1 iron uptake porin [Trichocoleus sp. FACHB-90]
MSQILPNPLNKVKVTTNLFWLLPFYLSPTLIFHPVLAATPPDGEVTFSASSPFLREALGERGDISTFGYSPPEETPPEAETSVTLVASDKPIDETPTVLEQIDQQSLEEIDQDTDPMSQVTNISQLRDVQPGDWAYEALRSLVERYGIISGYPDGTFRGNRSLSRYEFAAAVKATLDRITQVLAVPGPNAIRKEDLAILKRLEGEYTLELAILRGKVDAVTARTVELELTAFSKTTKLAGEVIFGVATIPTGEDAIGKDIDDATIFGHRTRLNLETSFTGRDLLLTRLQAEGLGSLSNRTLTPEGDLAFAGDTSNDVVIDELLYQFPINNNTQVVVAANADAADFTNTVNPYLDGDGGSGALSRFGTRPSIYYQVEGAGVGVRHSFSDKLELSLGYLAGDADNPAAGGGLFNSSYGALAQVLFKPSDRASIGLTYVHAYNNDLQTGSNDANLANLLNPLGFSVVTNSYGVEASFQISPQFVVGGWAGYTAARVIERGDASIWNWALTLAFPDLGKKGNLAGLIIGMEPKVTNQAESLSQLGITDPDTSLHLEAFYQYQLTDNISLTPGIIWLTAPDHNAANDDIFIGTLRTTFSF